jgi:hypothetical protein
MIGIKDTLELSAPRNGANNRAADRIFGVTKQTRQQAWNQPATNPQPTPLRRYTRNELYGLPGGIGRSFTPAHTMSTQHRAA